MKTKPELTHYQADVQMEASHSNIQPVRYFQAGIPPDRVADFFTTPDALALVGLRKEGETYVRH